MFAVSGRKNKHEKFMRLALKLAAKGKGETNPNPMVGAVVVKNNRLIAQGYHRKAGAAHAEVIALEKAGRAAQGATLYVTLEPCAHFGRTPPCVGKIIKSGIKEVVFAMSDPNPLNNGQGRRFLKRHGLKVVSGILEHQAQELNRVFVKYISTNMPYVTVKVAQSLDGKIATFGGDSRWITHLRTRRFTNSLRSQADAILVGINTVLKDNPFLTCRRGRTLCKKQPVKVIVDTRLRLVRKLNIFSVRSPARVIIATTSLAPTGKIAYFRKNCQVLILKKKNGKVDLKDLFRALAKQEIAHLLIEGGGEIIAAALKEKLVDEMIICIAPKIIGGRNAPTSVEELVRAVCGRQYSSRK